VLYNLVLDLDGSEEIGLGKDGLRRSRKCLAGLPDRKLAQNDVE
jgi:hypothetical protein